MQNSNASTLYVLSGAGLSAESGVATFRSVGGIWDEHRLERVCNYLTWKEHRDEVFEFYRERRQEVGGVEPNAAHIRLAQWQRRWGPDRVRLLTQNVDDLLERGGATNVVHLHGNLRELQCTACDTRFVPATPEAYHQDTRCPKCGSLKGVKPAVVFFYEAAPEYYQLKRLAKTLRPSDIVLVVGTAFQVVAPEMFLPEWRRGDTRNWQVNPEPDCPEWFGVNLHLPATQGLAELEEFVETALDAGDSVIDATP